MILLIQQFFKEKINLYRDFSVIIQSKQTLPETMFLQLLEKFTTSSFNRLLTDFIRKFSANDMPIIIKIFERVLATIGFNIAHLPLQNSVQAILLMMRLNKALIGQQLSAELQVLLNKKDYKLSILMATFLQVVYRIMKKQLHTLVNKYIQFSGNTKDKISIQLVCNSVRLKGYQHQQLMSKSTKKRSVQNKFSLHGSSYIAIIQQQDFSAKDRKQSKSKEVKTQKELKLPALKAVMGRTKTEQKGEREKQRRMKSMQNQLLQRNKQIRESILSWQIRLQRL